MPSRSSAHMGASSVSRMVSEPAPKRSSSQSATEWRIRPAVVPGSAGATGMAGGGGAGVPSSSAAMGGRSRQHRAGKGENACQTGGCQGPSCALHPPSHRDQSARGMSSVGVVMEV